MDQKAIRDVWCSTIVIGAIVLEVGALGHVNNPEEYCWIITAVVGFVMLATGFGAGVWLDGESDEQVQKESTQTEEDSGQGDDGRL